MGYTLVVLGTVASLANRPVVPRVLQAAQLSKHITVFATTVPRVKVECHYLLEFCTSCKSAPNNSNTTPAPSRSTGATASPAFPIAASLRVSLSYGGALVAPSVV